MMTEQYRETKNIQKIGKTAKQQQHFIGIQWGELPS